MIRQWWMGLWLKSKAHKSMSSLPFCFCWSKKILWSVRVRHDPTFSPRKMPNELFMQLAIDQAELALTESEVPIGCVIVHINGELLGSGRNRTNVSFNATRHAELEAIEQILGSGKYGPEVFKDCHLYVTCEPCIMCASLLRRLQFRHVYFGCWNERFGGCGTVLSIHNDPLPAPASGCEDSGSDDSVVEGGKLLPVLQCTGGLRREEAILLLRRFYLQENERGN